MLAIYKLFTLTRLLTWISFLLFIDYFGEMRNNMEIAIKEATDG